jgi:hypothetical protein
MPDGRVTSWIVPLGGHRFDLEDLPRWLSGQDVHVAPHEDGFALVIPTRVVGESYEPVLAFAESYLSLINGLGRLLNSKFRAVSLTRKILGLNSSGVVCHTVIAAGTAEMRMKAAGVGVAIGGVVQPDPGEGLAAPLMMAVSRTPRAHDALVIVGRQDLTWSELYLLFELVQVEVGGQMYELGWISKTDANLFTHTANSYSALRSAGRHGKDSGDPPRNPMEHAVAVDLVCALVLAWLNLVGSADLSRVVRPRVD